MSLTSSIPKRCPGLGLGLLVGCVVLFFLSLSVGAAGYSLAELWTEKTILLYARLPRSLGCVLAGAALAGAGFLLQTVLNNALASPGILGVNSGAGLAVILAAIALPGSVGARTAAAFLGAFAAVLLVYGIARLAGASRTTLVLSGVAVSSLFSAFIDTLITFFPETVMDKAAFSIGGFFAVTIPTLTAAGPVILLAGAAAVLLGRWLNILALGDEPAASLGLPVELCRGLALTMAAALAGAAVCIAGLIGFLGLIVPHMLRRLIGSDDHRRLALLTMMGGSCLTLLCDIAARLLFAPYELPVGILLAVLGVPFFLYLLYKQGRRRRT